MKKFFVALGVLGFVVGLGWLVPTMVYFTGIRLHDLWLMLKTGQPRNLGYDFTLLLWTTLAVWYLYSRDAFMPLFRRFPPLRPGVLMAYFTFVGATFASHAVYVGLVQGKKSLGSLTVGAVVMLLLTRAFMSWFFARWPALALVPSASEDGRSALGR